jgi:cobyric acid synthase
MKLVAIFIFFISIIIITGCESNPKKVDTYENLKKDLKGKELEKVNPHADAEEFENEVNNGGLNQYFFNSSGQNCFETLKFFKQTGKIKEAKILEEAIHLINPNKIYNEEFIEKLRKRTVDELDDSLVNSKLEELAKQFYK